VNAPFNDCSKAMGEEAFWGVTVVDVALLGVVCDELIGGGEALG